MSATSPTAPPAFELSRYLLSKTTVDDRALHQGVIDELRAELGKLNSPKPRVLEIGCGVGTMLRRLTEWRILGDAEYTFVDIDAALLHTAKNTLLALPGFEAVGDGLLYRHDRGCVEVSFRHADALQFAVQPENRGKYDLLIANALLDLLDLDPALRSLWQCLVPEGLYWFTINFDGETLLLPESPLDEAVMAVYHRSMDERIVNGKKGGTSRTGRALLTQLPHTGASLLAAGSSDWVVFPHAGHYPHDEEHFLRHILDTVIQTVQGDPSMKESEFTDWAQKREAQISAGELCYVAHQLDVMGKSPSA